MIRYIFILLLFLAACSQQEGPLFDHEYASLCDVYNDITKYAVRIHIDKTMSQMDELRRDAAHQLADAYDYHDPLPNSQNCEDIKALVQFETKKNETEVYSDALSYFMQNLDPHSLYIPESRMKDFTNVNNNVNYGIGIEPQYINRAVKMVLPIDSLILDYVYDQTPAFGKLQAGDEIENIDGEEIKGKLLGSIKFTNFDPGSVKIKVTRLSEPVIISKKSFQKPAFYSKPIHNSQGNFQLIRVLGFYSGLTSQIKKELMSLNASDIDGLILDLRGNPGGFVDEGVSFLRLFLSKQGEIFHTSELQRKPSLIKKATQHKYTGTLQAIFKKPMVVLVDSDTASVSEIVSGVLQRESRAKIVGNKTFGKASVQIDKKISARNGLGGNLRLTISLVYYPDNDTHQNKGLSPDYVIHDEKWSQALETLKQKKLSPILYESDYRNSIKPDSSFSESSNHPGNLNQLLEHSCEKMHGQECWETTAQDLLAILIHQNTNGS